MHMPFAEVIWAHEMGDLGSARNAFDACYSMTI